MKLNDISELVMKRFANRSETVEMTQTKTLHRSRTISAGVLRIRPSRIAPDSIEHQLKDASLPSLIKEQRGSFVKAVNKVKSHAKLKDDTFDEFFPEHIYQKRAVFMLVQLKTHILVPILSPTHPDLIMLLLQIIGDRLYTLFYAQKILEPGHQARTKILDEAQDLINRSKLPVIECGIREAAYAVYYALIQLQSHHQFSEDLVYRIITESRACIQSCIERELKLKPIERESMYIFQPAISNTPYPEPRLLPL